MNEMEKHVDVMKRSLELGKTVMEGFQHTQRLIRDGQFEQAIMMFEESLNGYAQLEESVRPVMVGLQDNEIEDQLEKVQQVAHLIVDAFRNGDFSKVNEVLQFTMIPRFKSFMRSIEQTFSKYVLS